MTVGRHVARSTTVLTWLVRQSSGLERPSPEAVTSGLLGGLGALAPAAMGPIGGACVEAACSLGVLALATWTVRLECTGEGFEQALGGAIADVERRGLCRGRSASLWRAAAGLGQPSGAIFADATMAGARVALGRTLGKVAERRLPVTAATSLESFGRGVTLVKAWRAIGDAARLVEATREHAAREASRGLDPSASLPQARQVVSTMIAAGSRPLTAAAAAASR